jgi:hypothetical protein
MPTPGSQYTLVSTTGSLIGTFAEPNPTPLRVLSPCAPTNLWAQLNYTSNAATATISTSQERARSNINFSPLGVAVNSRTGAITFTESVADPGTFRWVLTFQNGKFGVFAASKAKCKAGFARLNGQCRRSRILFAKGHTGIVAAGTVKFTVKPSASAVTALRNAHKRRRGLAVTAIITFDSPRGLSPVSHTQLVTVKLNKK